MVLSIRGTIWRFTIISTLAFGIVISQVGYHYFFKGADVYRKKTMLAIAQHVKLDARGYGEMLDFHVFDEWNKLPSIFHRHFDADCIELNQLNDRQIDRNIFGPPQQELFLLKALGANGQPLYIAKMYSRTVPPEEYGSPPISKVYATYQPDGIPLPAPHAISITLIAITLLSVYLVCVHALLRRLTNPVLRLKSWAKSMNSKSLLHPSPNFRFKELNELASIVRYRFRLAQQSADREQQFLSYASHELRTPLTIAKTSTELIKVLSHKHTLPPMMLAKLAQLEVAHNNISELTETLLWLSRDEERPLDAASIKLDKMVQTVLKEVKTAHPPASGVGFDIKCEPYELRTFSSPCKIVLMNLIRNACNHTNPLGVIRITQTNSTVIISNEYTSNTAGSNSFGLGLQLVEKLSKKYNWTFTRTQTATEYVVTITF